jgi:hypothetical protein
MTELTLETMEALLDRRLKPIEESIIDNKDGITKIAVTLEQHVSDQRDFGPLLADTNRKVKSLETKTDKLGETVSLHNLAIKSSR